MVSRNRTRKQLIARLRQLQQQELRFNQANRLIEVYRLGQELNQLPEPELICSLALQTAGLLVPFKKAGFGVLDEAGKLLDYHYYPTADLTSAIRLKLPVDPSQRLERLSAGATLSAPADDGSPVWWHSVIMQTHNRYVGALDFGYAPAFGLSTDDHQILQTLTGQTTMAIENAQFQYESRRRIDELAAIHLIGHVITSTLNLEEALTTITDHTIRLFDAGMAAVVLYDESQNNLHFQAVSGPGSEQIKGKRLLPEQGLSGWVIKTGQPALVTNVAQDPRYLNTFDHLLQFTPYSIMSAPLQTRRRTIGAIEVINKKNHSFTEEDLGLLGWLATPAATAIENARLFEAEHLARTQAEILREATATLTSTLNLDQVLTRILLHLEQVLAYDHAYVYMQTDDWLYIVSARSPLDAPSGAEVNRIYPSNNAIYQQIKDSRRPVILPDAQQPDCGLQLWTPPPHVHGWMGVPLIVRNEVIGCLVLNSRQISAYDRQEPNLAQIFANQAAIAIHNARLFTHVQAGHERLQSLSRRLVEVQEAEKRHIARELHDEAGQSLASLMVELRLLEQNLNNSTAVAQSMAKLKRTINNVLENLHQLAVDLRPASLDHLGLVPALRQYIGTISKQYNLETQFEVIGLTEKRLPPEVEINLYRIVQEALTNVVRHAQASRVDILLEKRGNEMVTIIEDNGIGFDVSQAEQSQRLGLLGMHERAEMLGATLIIESTPGTGTTIFVEIPYAH